MKDDPRHRNETCDSSSIGAYMADYAGQLQTALLSVDSDALHQAQLVIEAAAETGNQIFAIGNGGSAAIADHLCCDLTKGTHTARHRVIDTRSMSSNVALYSAVANDYGFGKVFSRQIEMLGRAGDVLLAVSSSGNSPNIVAAVAAAHELGMKTIGLSGFSGGELKATAEVVLHVDVNNYGIVEDAHQSIMHVLAQFIAAHRDR